MSGSSGKSGGSVSRRPTELYPIFAPLSSLKGVGRALDGKLGRYFVGGASSSARVKDLLWHLPRDLVMREAVSSLRFAIVGRVATLAVTVGLHVPPPRVRGGKMRPYCVNAVDVEGEILQLLWFRGDAAYIRGLAAEGSEVFVSGRVEEYRGVKRMVHPDYVVRSADKDMIPLVEAIYSLPAGVGSRVLHKIMAEALAVVPSLPEWIDSSFLRQQGWNDWRSSLLSAHMVESLGSIEPTNKARSRLAYDELLANQLGLLILREYMRKRSGQSIQGTGRLTEALFASLPFRLTGGQERAIAEITSDMREPTMMMRLLQGDVGSGKTIVALVALLTAVEAGGQGALMAPTEVLAQQHYDTLSGFLEGLGVNVFLLCGRHKGRVRKSILEALRSAETHIIIGTHALFQADVDYARLDLVVIDEQHRFGVEQRLALLKKGKSPDLLAMTATPIPRTLLMTSYGDLDISQLREKPLGFRPIKTSLVNLERADEVIQRLGRPLSEGAQVYWVCPLVEESEVSDFAAAEERHKDLTQRLDGYEVGLVHGRMKSVDKNAVMQKFKERRLSVLVATTVIEVGIDSSSANIMIVEQAERFGLAQLHQLRGRVGRGSVESYCVLLYSPQCGDIARRRLQSLRDTHDGFVIAEQDMRLRGGGEVLGVRQSGLPRFHFADLAVHHGLLSASRQQARMIVEKDYRLKQPENHVYRVLLHLFETASVVSYLRSG